MSGNGRDCSRGQGRSLGRTQVHGHTGLLRWGLLPLALVLSVGCLQQADANQPILIQWFWGAPETVTYIGTGEMVSWMWFDKGNYSIEGYNAAQNMFKGVGGGKNAIAQQGFLYTYTFNKSGIFDYRCVNHPYVMFGQIKVKPAVNFGGVTLNFFLGISTGGLSAVVCEGDTVKWEWGDDLPHGLTGYNNDTSLFTGRGANGDMVTEYGFVYSKKFKTAGTFPYKCHNHGEQMYGVITVVPKKDCSLPWPKKPANSIQTPPPAPPPPRKSPPPPVKKPPPPKGKKQVVVKSPPPKGKKQVIAKSPPPKRPPPRKPPPPKANQKRKLRGSERVEEERRWNI